MNNRIMLLVVPAVWLALPVDPAAGRLVEPWSYEKLLKESDLVVVAVAKKAEDTDDKPTDPLFKRDRKHVVGRTSTLEVKGTLKGKAPGAEIKVLHFYIKPPWDIVNGPRLVTFRTTPTALTIDKDSETWHAETEYLLFLKARKDGRYEPVAGQYDVDLSVREMYRPVSAMHGK
jgi:hypothetical protein